MLAAIGERGKSKELGGKRGACPFCVHQSIGRAKGSHFGRERGLLVGMGEDWKEKKSRSLEGGS